MSEALVVDRDGRSRVISIEIQSFRVVGLEIVICYVMTTQGMMGAYTFWHVT